MKKKILLGMGALVAMAVGVAGLSAFEAHVINVTAQIENALQVPSEAINFGTVFPQEKLERELTLTLSASFQAEDDADDVDYIIRQKPKCGVTTDDGETLAGPTWTGHVIPDGENDFRVDCDEDSPEGLVVGPGQTAGPLPNLCPYISKLGEDDNDGETPSFHHPWQVVGGVVEWLDTPGRMVKSEGDESDTWIIDLAVPCFGDHCAQDWEKFVTDINPGANPDEFVLDENLEHKIFGCNLWIEVTNVSRVGEEPEPEPEPEPETGTLTLLKNVVDVDGIDNEPADTAWTLFATGPDSISGAEEDASITNAVVEVGAYVLSESDVDGYSQTNLECEGDGGALVLVGGDTVTVAADDNVVCTFTNTEETEA